MALSALNITSPTAPAGVGISFYADNEGNRLGADINLNGWSVVLPSSTALGTYAILSGAQIVLGSTSANVIQAGKRTTTYATTAPVGNPHRNGDEWINTTGGANNAYWVGANNAWKNLA